MTRPLPILVALAVTSPALLAVARGGMGVDAALLRLLLALLVCAVVDAGVRAFWPAPPVVPDAGSADGIPGREAGTPGRRRTDAAAGGTGR